MDPPFSEWHSSAQGFVSSWKGERSKTTQGCQTSEIVQDEKSVQSVTSNSVQVQTMEDPSVEVNSKGPYPPSLFAFFSKVTDPLCEYLKENEDAYCSRIFNDFYNGSASSEKEAAATKLHTLRNSNTPQNFEGTSIAWSRTGSQIAVGYGARTHDGWCTHNSQLSIWNVNRKLNEGTPHMEINLNSCVTALDFHPVESTILVCGLHSGEIALMDLFSADRKQTNSENLKESASMKTKEMSSHGDSGETNESSNSNEGVVTEGSGHSMKVVSITWICLTPSQFKDVIKKNKNASNYCILSGAKDGFICLWSVNKTNNQLVLEKKFVVWADVLPANLQVGNRAESGMQEIGLTNFSTCKDDSTAFVFSTFGGYIFQGNLLSEIEINDSGDLGMGQGDETVVFEPGSLCISMQQNLVTSVDCSPYHRNLFLAATIDGLVILQNLLQPMKPTMEFFLRGCVDVKWSRRPMMFAATDSSNMKIFDLSLDNKNPTLTIEHVDPLVRIAFNWTDVGVVAACDTKGFLHIWKLPQSLSSHETKEMELLIDLGHPTDGENVSTVLESNSEQVILA